MVQVHPDVYTPAEINTKLIPMVIAKRFPDLTESQVNEVRHAVLLDLNFKNAVSLLPGDAVETTSGELEVKREGENVLIKLAKKFVNLDDLSIDLIDSINPFEHAYEILSKHLDERVLQTIHGNVVAARLPMSAESQCAGSARTAPCARALHHTRRETAFRASGHTMSERPTSFADIFAEEDVLGLLAPKSSAPTRSSEEEIIVNQFAAINAFFDKHGVEPGNAENGRSPSLTEYTLEGNLEAFRSDEEHRSLLAPYDRHGLLGAAVVAAPVPTSIDDIIDSEDPLLSSLADDIFILKHVAGPAVVKINAPDEIAKRRPSPDFDRFAPIFAEIRDELKSGRRYTKRFESAESIVPGSTFILNGIISYVASVDERQRRGKDYNGRIRVIFDNGTEANYLWRSFARAFYEDENGLQILESAPTVSGPLFGGVGHVSGPLFSGEPDKDEFGEVRGIVHIVESLSEDPNIVALKGRLYKIGFTTQPVDKRLADVEKDPTFLCSKVQLRATYKTNFSPRKLEQLLHQFFAHANLQLEVVLGRSVTPKEWFVVPLDLVEEAVTRILYRSIVNYRYDAVSPKILPR